MTVGVMSAAFAADTEEMKKVLETVKSRIGSTDDYDKFESETYTDSKNQITEYGFLWSDSSVDSCLEVKATPDGIITSFRRNEQGILNAVPVSERVSKSQLRVAAENFVKQLNPDIAQELVVEEMYFTSNSACADITEYKNGYPIDGNKGFIEIDLMGEKLSKFRILQKNGKKFETGNIISKDDAVKKFKENIGAELYYYMDYNKSEETKVFVPKYCIANNSKYISALNGEAIRVDIFFNTDLIKNESLSEIMKDTAYNYDFADIEYEELESIGGFLSPEKAFEFVKNLKCIDIPDVKFEDIKVGFDNGGFWGVPKYIFNYYRREGDFVEYFLFEVNARNGEILTAISYSYDKDDDNYSVFEFSKDETKKIIENAFKELAPEKYTEYASISDDMGGGGIYRRYVNDVAVNDDYASFVINPRTKKIMSFNMNYSDGEFSSVSGVISKSEAEDIFIDKFGYEAKYVFDCTDDEYKLCYTFSDEPIKMDPFTGKSFEFESPTIEEYSDVSGHYAEDIANQLAEINIGFAGGELRPDEPIKQKEFAYLIYKAVQQNGIKAVVSDNLDGDELYEYIDFIAPEEVNPDAAVTRRDAAKFTVRAMGYIDVAKLDIFKPMFNDMTEDVGYASILAGLKILNGDGNGNFNPEGVLTRAQALIIVYNYLNR